MIRLFCREKSNKQTHNNIKKHIMNDVNHYLNPAEEKMEMAVEYLDEALAHIRAGKANPKILDGIRVDYYGSAAPISNVANISVPDARTIAITPWEKSMFKVI